MNLCGVVILYNPDEQVCQRIESYRNTLEFLILIDNSVQDNRHRFLNLLASGNVQYQHNGTNEGIAKRLNEAAAIARKKNFHWLLTMDQDSYFEPAALKHYLACVFTYPQLQRVAMFGLEHDERLLTAGDQCVFTKATLLITSGSLINLNIHDEIGGFDEQLFIDQVDHEFCFRSIINGFEVVKLQNVLMRHAIGNVSQHRSFKSLKQTTRALHSPIRLYFMVRNYFYVKEKYNNQFEKEMVGFRRDLFVRIKNNLLYGRKRKQILRFILQGYRDYKQGRMGKLLNN